MWNRHNRIERKYLVIELVIMVYLCYLGAIISDLEYSYYEEHNIWKFTTALEYRLVTGSYSFVFCGVYYWLFLKRFVFKKQLVYVALSAIAFIFCWHLYDKFFMKWSIPKLLFLSAKLRADALRDYRYPHIFFLANYLLEKIFLIIGFAFLIRSLQQDEQVKALKEQQLITELNYLKAQLQPHFFFNTLNNIYGLAISQSESTAPMVAKLSEMMRYILYESDRQYVPLQQEINFLNNYVEIEKIRHTRHISIAFDVQGISAHEQIEPLLLLPFIENAFKHGIQNELEKGFVNIVICVTGKELMAQVTNSKPFTAPKKPGVGLLNVQKRLALLYANRHQLNIEETENTYQVNLTLQLL